VNTVAPTGSISMIADCSAGIEPLFAVAFMRNQAGVQMPDVNGTFVAVAEAEGWYSDELMHRIATTGHIHHPEVPEHVQRIFRTAHDIAPRAHVEMQAAWQRHVDSAISKTTNFPNTATPEQVEEIYRLAFALRCKGITVYRDGSRSGQVLSTGATTTQAATPAVSDEAAAVDRAALAELQGLLSTQEAAILRLEEEVLTKQREIAELELRASQGRSRVLRDRPNILRGVTACVPTGLGKLYVTANFDEAGQLFEMFAQLGKAGSEASAMLQALMRMVSASLRAGVPASAIHHQLRGITSDQAVGFGDKRVRSVPDAVAQAMAEILAGKEAVQQDLPFVVAPVALSPARDVDAHLRGTACPECGAPLERGSGCEICRSCGYSKCG
jgi:ribonucleoside-diphosphate reductase alpha chain